KKVTLALDNVTKLVGKLQEEQKQTKQALYFHSIALADREWWLNNVDKAEEILVQCPAELRDWEWHYLKRRCRAGMILHPTQDPPGPMGPQGTPIALAFSPDGQR